MSPVSRAETTRSDPPEWRSGARAAREARKDVAAVVARQIETMDMTGSMDYLILRLRNVAAAEREGDPMLRHAALVDLAAAAGAQAARVRVESPGAFR